MEYLFEIENLMSNNYIYLKCNRKLSRILWWLSIKFKRHEILSKLLNDITFYKIKLRQFQQAVYKSIPFHRKKIIYI